VLEGFLVGIIDASLLRKAMQSCSGVDSPRLVGGGIGGRRQWIAHGYRRPPGLRSLSPACANVFNRLYPVCLKRPSTTPVDSAVCS
jgi:hypothetical protein